MNARRQSTQRVALGRALSKLGYCSRNQARELIKSGRVRVTGVVLHDLERRIRLGSDRIEVDGQCVRGHEKVYLMLNKPRGLVTTTSDEKGRDTVFRCFGTGTEDPQVADSGVKAGDSPILPRVFPVGRLDRASEGLLLFTNDTVWAAQITAPESHLEKTYHVQVDCLADQVLVRRMQEGLASDRDFLAAKRVSVLRLGTKNSWLEVVLDEGKNRHIRRLLAALGVHVLRLVRVAIGPLQLGTLAKAEWRHLTDAEILACTYPRSS